MFRSARRTTSTATTTATPHAGVPVRQLAQSTRRRVRYDAAAASARCVDVDRSEARFLLAGHADGSIRIHALETTTTTAQGERLLGTDEFFEETIECVASSLSSASTGSGHRGVVSAVSWYPADTGMFVTSSFDKTVRVWDTNRMEAVLDFRLGTMVHDCALSPSAAHQQSSPFGSLIATATGGGRDVVRLCDMDSGASVLSLSGGHRGGTLSVKWHPHDQYVLVSGGANDGRICIWDVRQTGAKALVTTLCHTEGAGVNGLAFSNDGLALVSAGGKSSGQDRRISLVAWDAISCEQSWRTVLPDTVANAEQTIHPVVVPYSTSSSRSADQAIVYPVNDQTGLGYLSVFSMERREQIHAIHCAMSNLTGVSWRQCTSELYAPCTDGSISVVDDSMHCTFKSKDIMPDDVVVHK